MATSIKNTEDAPGTSALWLIHTARVSTDLFKDVVTIHHTVRDMRAQLENVVSMVADSYAARDEKNLIQAHAKSDAVEETVVHRVAIARYNFVTNKAAPHVELHFPSQLWAHAMVWAFFDYVYTYTLPDEMTGKDLLFGVGSSFFSTEDKKGNAVFTTVEEKRASVFQRLVLRKSAVVGTRQRISAMHSG